MAELLLVSATTGVINSLLSKLATMMRDEYRLHKNVRKDIEFLQVELGAMHAFLLGMADIEEPDEPSKLRVRVVRELSYDIEDYVDKFILLADPESSSKKKGISKLMNKSRKLVKEFKIRRSIFKKVKDMKHQVVEVGDRSERYKINKANCSTKKAVVDPRVVALFKDASELVGLDGPRDDLIKWLKNQEGDTAQQPKVLSIVGAGGLGKTTLATQIYTKLGVNFECHAFVSVSRNPDLTKIFCSILSDIGGQVTIPMEEPRLIRMIREILENKRYFIVVDDIWHKSTWEIMEPAFYKNSCGSRIIVTTRINEVAKSCSSTHEDLVYQIKPLGLADSRKLFFNRIFGCEEKCPSNLSEASDDILRKCGGLPLAIITISSLLVTMETKDQWDRVQRSPGFRFGNSSEVDRMRGILGLSYFELPPHLRSCLLYLAQFPEDYVIRRYRVVQRWIAEGFIHCEDGQDLVEFGDLCFHDLVNRSLVQPLDIAYDGKAMACRVHDTILDFLIQKSTEENFSTLLSSHSKVPHLSDAKIRRLSLQENDSEEIVTISPELNTSHLRSLSVFVYYKQLSLIMDFSCLRVLDLEDCAGLEDRHLINISRLSQLRYLNISNTGISKIPAEIGLLRSLEILLCKRDSVDGPELPETVTQLARLVRLFVSSHNTLPDGIGRWNKSLQHLDVINPIKCSVKFLQELGELINLRYLSIMCDNWYDEACHTEELVSSLRKLDAHNLRDLSLHLEFEASYLDYAPDAEFSFPDLQSIRRLTLILMGPRMEFTKWLVSLANLEYLYICIRSSRGIEQQDLQLIGSIPTLLYFGLSLIKIHDSARPTIIRGGFRQLQRFSFQCYEYEERLMIQEGAMSMLKDIELSIHSANYSTEEEVIDFGIQHLPCLSSIRVDTYYFKREMPTEDVENAFKSLVKKHPKHPTLLVTPCSYGYEGSIKFGHLKAL